MCTDTEERESKAGSLSGVGPGEHPARAGGQAAAGAWRLQGFPGRHRLGKGAGLGLAAEVWWEKAWALGTPRLNQTSVWPLPSARARPALSWAGSSGAGRGRWAVSSAAPRGPCVWPLVLPQRGLWGVCGGLARSAPLRVWPPDPLHSVCSVTCEDRFSLWRDMEGLLVQGVILFDCLLSC